MLNTFTPADILIPKVETPEKWSVVACDQYTSEPQYWQDVSDYVKDAPSAFHLVFPEVYLHNSDFDARIEQINSYMNRYLEEELFRVYNDSLVYIERTMKTGKIRRGIIGKIDLLDYDYRIGSQSLIRATEGTVLERIPPRVRIREDAPLELPHVMLLIDDETDSIINSVAISKNSLEKLYDFNLMQGGGNVQGYRISDTVGSNLLAALQSLADKALYQKKYDVSDNNVLLFAVGDGNHSLATAKECYNKIAAELPAEEALLHPARYALAELVNLHDNSLEFEAIHRIVFDVDTDNMLEELFRFYDCELGCTQGQTFGFVTKDRKGIITVKNPKSNLAVGTLQDFIDNYTKNFGGRVDYIHGEDVVKNLAQQDGNIGFLLPGFEKSELFKTVIVDGVLPRKTFSMGEACEKRFYLEARKIK